MASYFSHDSNARNDSKVLKLRMAHGAAGYGVYFMILERLREESDYMCIKDYKIIAYELQVKTELVKSVVEDFDLFAFTSDGERFYSNSFNKRMKMKDAISSKRAEAGKRGMAKRWQQHKADNKTITSVIEEDNKVITNDNKAITNTITKDNNKSKEKESKENIVSNETDNTHAHEGGETPPNLSDKEKAKADKKKKYKYADYVSLTRDEYAKLCEEHGEDPVKAMIETLNNYKGSKGKTYKSDYLAIKNWVINRYYEDIQRYGDKRTGIHGGNGCEDDKGTSEATLRTDGGTSDGGNSETQKNYAERF